MTKQRNTQRGRKAPIISVRVTAEEQDEIARAANGLSLSLSGYVRQRLFADSKGGSGGSAPCESKCGYGERRLSSIERQRYLAQALSKLGDSNLHDTMKTIADAARLGLLPLTPDVTADIRAATDYIAEVRLALLRGLGLRPGGPDDSER